MKPVSERIPISDSTLLMPIRGGNCEGLSLSCCPNLCKIALSLRDGSLGQSCEFVVKCVSTITSTQLSTVLFNLDEDLPYCSPPGEDLRWWNSLKIIMGKLVMQYQPRCEGDEMVVASWDPDAAPSQAKDFLWRDRERGTTQVIFF